PALASNETSPDQTPAFASVSLQVEQPAAKMQGRLSSASEPQQSEIATFDPSVVPEEKQEFELAVLADTASDPDARSTEPLPAAAPAKPIAGEIQTSNAQENAPGSEQTASVETVVTFDTT